jgi:hypothetical protein
MTNYIKKRNAILSNWTVEEGSSMRDVHKLKVIIDSMRRLQRKLKVSKVCRLYRGQLVHVDSIRRGGDVVIPNPRLSSWTKSLSSAALYSLPNGYQGSGHNKIPFVFYTKYNFNRQLGLDLECLSDYDYYPDEKKVKSRYVCECYNERNVVDKDREVIVYKSNFVLKLDTMKLAFMNNCDQEIQINISSKRILKGIQDNSMFKNESLFPFSSRVFYPQQLPDVKAKILNKGYTEDMISKLHMYIRCTVVVQNRSSPHIPQ